MLTRERVVYAPAYDAGSETNDELCAHIPGPPGVCVGEGISLEDNGEGYVHIPLASTVSVNSLRSTGIGGIRSRE